MTDTCQDCGKVINISPYELRLLRRSNYGKARKSESMSFTYSPSGLRKWELMGFYAALEILERRIKGEIE